MASKIVSRLSSRLNSFAFKLNNNPSLSSLTSPSSSTRRLSVFSRLPVELSGVVGSMLPLHGAIASSRLVSCLSSESVCWGVVPQGISMPL